jgi:hypothetical protein
MMLLLTSTLLLADDDTNDVDDINDVNDTDNTDDTNNANDADDANDERRRKSSIEEEKKSRLDTSLDRVE